MAKDNKLDEKPEGATGVPARRSKAYRDGLLGRLPKLGEPSWDAREVFNVHESMAGLRDLGADSLLEPLSKLAERDNG